MPKRSFKRFVEQELGKFLEFLIYAVLEWILIITLFIDGFLAFLANEFARFFELKIPCLLCTRIDHVLVQRSPDFYYNDSICDCHRKNMSSLAYCHMHKKLSEIRKMCEGCLLSFATEKESDCDTYKSLVGILHKDLELLVDDEQEFQLTFPASGSRKDENFIQQNVDQKRNKIVNNNNNVVVQQQRCSCCGELLKVRSYGPKNVSHAPAPSPRVSFNLRNLELPHVKETELNKLSNNKYEVQEDEYSANAINRVKGDATAAMVPLLTEPDESTEDKTPSFIRGGSRFFGVPLSDSAQNSPRWSLRSVRRSLPERTENASDPSDSNSGSHHGNISDGDYVLHHLKRQVRLDRKSLMALYMELDEERSASAEAANNAMAMITRLQAEKAAVQMEALQYQRMMEEQAEYDQEALQVMKDLLVKREEEMKDLEDELEAYREKHGCLSEEEDEKEKGFFVEQGVSRTDNSDNNRDLKTESNAQVHRSGEGSNLEENADADDNKSPKGEEEETGSKTMLMKELLDIQDRLKALETDRGLLKHVSEVLDACEGEAILTQVTQNLHMLCSLVALPVSDNNIGQM